jgi:hypothetical protein
LVVGSIVGLIALAGGIMGYLVHEHNIELAQAQAQAQAKADAERKALIAQQDAEDKKKDQEMAALRAQLATASSDADRAKIRAQLEAKINESHRPKSTNASKSDSKPKGPKVNTKTNDPLGGLDL